MMRYLAPMLALTTAVCSCSIFGVDGNQVSCKLPDGSVGSGLYGCWDMISTAGGYAGGEHRPHDEGYSVWLRLLPDSQYTSFRDGEVIRDGTFALTSVDGQQALRLADSIGSASPILRLVSFQGSDTLVLADYCYDCYTSVYVRLKK